MTMHAGRGAALEYYPCRYGSSRVLFRGPRRHLDGDYMAFLGGTETYGRFIETPFPTLLEQRVSRACVNLGAVNAGLDLYLGDPAILELASEAKVKVVQVMGAHAMSNRHYQVHQRRNDRFLRASSALQDLYPEVDFTEFHFVRHMLQSLRDTCDDRFTMVVDELRMAWSARMKSMLTLLRGNVILLWFDRKPVPAATNAVSPNEPPFITRDMIDALRPRVATVVEVIASDDAMADGTTGMVFNEFETSAAAELMGPRAHEEATDALEGVTRAMILEDPDAA